MKKLAILCALACALVACEKPMNENEEAKPEIKTVSFDAELRTYYPLPYLLELKDIIGSGEKELAKDGRIYLVAPETWDIIENQKPFLGSWIKFPTDEYYFDNKNDLIAGFEDGRFPAVATIPATNGHLNNIPFGEYVLVGVLGLYHNDTLKSYKGSYLRLKVDSSFIDNPVVLKATIGDTEYSFWQNTKWYAD
ncbi:MAG: hypothetical protein K2M92_02870 [Bacteroidales bacterium]|nr:hypothetical protein [Bacteroidales bacterium]